MANLSALELWWMVIIGVGAASHTWGIVSSARDLRAARRNHLPQDAVEHAITRVVSESGRLLKQTLWFGAGLVSAFQPEPSHGSRGAGDTAILALLFVPAALVAVVSITENVRKALIRERVRRRLERSE